MAKITWTHTDEAPALAALAFLPVVRSFTKGTDITVDLADISLAGRIIYEIGYDFVRFKYPCGFLVALEFPIFKCQCR